MPKRGRPSLYSPEIAEEICERLASGESMRRICQDEHMPGRRTVEGWMDADPDFRAKCARAREAGYLIKLHRLKNDRISVT
jgi:hypothetical protein